MFSALIDSLWGINHFGLHVNAIVTIVFRRVSFFLPFDGFLAFFFVQNRLFSLASQLNHGHLGLFFYVSTR